MTFLDCLRFLLSLDFPKNLKVQKAPPKKSQIKIEEENE
jgi:hypothetical protein